METVAAVATTVSDKVKIAVLFRLENISFVTHFFGGDFQEFLCLQAFQEESGPDLL